MNKLEKIKQYFPIYKQGWIIYFAAMMFALAILSLLQQISESDRHVPLVFVLVVLVVSLATDGYFYGILASVTGVFTANYTFTYPYAKMDFTLSGYPLTFVTMLAVSVAVCTLATRLKRQEQLRLESEKEKMRANLLRAISHDLRTPLTSISGSISAVLDGNVKTEQQKRELLEDARTDAEWLYRMVENLLSITKITGEQMNCLNKREEALEELFGAVAIKFRKHSPDVKLTVTVPEELLLVPMDGVLIEQVLINLLNNAVLHGEHTTGIRMEAKLEKDYAVISVTDNGKGLDSGNLEHIFDGTHKFSNSSLPDKGRSLGIGLSVCKTIIEAHGGKISASNAPEGGACFSFTLPIGGDSSEY